MSWLIYSLIQSYRNLEKELKEIRKKCIGSSSTTPTTPLPSVANNKNNTQDTSYLSTITNAISKEYKSMYGTDSNIQKFKNMNSPSTSTIYVPPGKLTPNMPVNTPVKTSSTPTPIPIAKQTTGAYTPTGDQIYSTDDNDSQSYDNDPLSSMRHSLINGLLTVKNYAAI